MIDGFVLLTPLLLLAVVALLGFVGCYMAVTLDPSQGVVHVATTVKTGLPGMDTITADPLFLEGGELIVATLQWGSAAVQPAPGLSGAVFSPVPGGGPFNWSGMKVQTFLARNPENQTNLAVQATVPGGSNVDWHLCVSAYRNVDASNPIFSPLQNGSTFIGTNPQLPPININEGDTVYAVALAADSDGTFPGSNSYVAGAGLVAEFPAVANPIVEDGGAGTSVIAQATNTSKLPNPRAFIFAMGLKSGTS